MFGRTYAKCPIHLCDISSIGCFYCNNPDPAHIWQTPPINPNLKSELEKEIERILTEAVDRATERVRTELIKAIREVHKTDHFRNSEE